MIRHAPSIGIGIGISLGSGGVLEPYPLAGRVLDLGAFNYTLAEVPDISGEDNDAVLYSGRGVNLAGADYVELPDAGATKSITVLARSSTDTTLYATDDAAQSEDATATITADGTWQEVTLTFANAISGKVRLGSDGTSFFSGDLADARCKDASGNLLDQFYLNEHTDTAAAGLDGLPVIGRNGNIGQYVNCAAVVQEGFDSDLAGLGAYGDNCYSTGSTTIEYPSIPEVSRTGQFSIRMEYLAGVGIIDSYNYLLGNVVSPTNRFTLVTTYIGGSLRIAAFFWDGSTYVQQTSIIIQEAALYTVEVQWDGVDLTLTVNDVVATGTSTYTARLSSGSCLYRNGTKGIIRNVEIYSDSNFGTQTRAIAGDGSTVADWTDSIGSLTPTTFTDVNTVAELRTTPPQVLGMDFNQYRWFNGVDTVVNTGIEPPVKGRIVATFTYTDADSLIISGVNPSQIYGASISCGRDAGTVVATIEGPNTVYTSVSLDGFSAGDIITADVSFDTSTSTISATFNGNSTNGSLTGRLANDPSTYLLGVNTNMTSYYDGILYDVTFYGADQVTPISSYKGYGETPWKDTISSNDGTESGTFENVLVPESLTKGTDALGNAITPRTNKTFNADGSGYALSAIPEMTACSVILRGNFFKDYSAVDGVLLDSNGTSKLKVWKNDAQLESELTFIFAGRAYKITIPDSNATIALIYDGVGLSVNAYVDGSAQTPIGLTGTLGASIDAADLYICSNTLKAETYKNQVEVSPIYNRALTADQVATLP